MIFDTCSRCHRPITSDYQACFVTKGHREWGSMRFPCVPASDITVKHVADKLKPVPILEDYYRE